MSDMQVCFRCKERPRQPSHSWCLVCYGKWQRARYAVRTQTEPAFVAANNRRSREQYHRRHRGATTQRTCARIRQRTLPDTHRWCWWCQEAHALAAFTPRPGTTRGVSYSCREGLRIWSRLQHRRR